MTRLTKTAQLSTGLERAAKITREDIERARLAWQRDAPAKFLGLLDAEPSEEPEKAKRGRG